MKLPNFLWLTRRHVPIWVVLLLGTALSSLVFQIKEEAVSARQEVLFSEFAHERSHRFQWEMDVHVDTLQSLRTFMAASPGMDRTAFQAFTRGLIQREGGLRSLQWIPVVPAARREVFEERAVEDGLEGFHFFQMDEQGQPINVRPADQYIPIYYSEPERGNRPWLGLDLGSSGVSPEWLQTVGEEGGLIVVGADQIRSGLLDDLELLLLLPVIEAEGDEEVIAGFVSATLDLGAIGREIFSDRDEVLEVTLGGVGSTSAEPLSIFVIGGALSGQRIWRFVAPIAVGDREWEFSIKMDGTTLGAGATTESWSLLGIGLLLTGFVALWMRQRQVYLFSVEQEVKERTAALSRINEDLQQEMAQRRQVETSLVESENRFREAFLHAPIGIALLSASGGWMQVNQALTEMTGFTEDELQQKTMAEMLHPDDVQEELARMGQLLAGEIGTFALEHRFRHHSGGYVWVLMNVSQVRDKGGRLLYFICQILDITVRKQALEDARSATERLEATSEVLRRRNQELQDFAYVASHDLQEPLRKIRAFGDRLEKTCEGVLTDQAKDYLGRMRDAAKRMQILIGDLLAFSRISTEANPFVPVDLGGVVREVLSDLETAIEETGARVEVEDLPTLEADATQMRQLIQNLIGNGLKYGRAGVPIRIRIYVTDGAAVDGVGALSGDGFLLHVQDNGIGFEEKYLDRIFTVFQRLHGRHEYPGTGVGLAICRRIVERHRGWISARSIPGEGSTFMVALPRRQSENIVV